MVKLSPTAVNLTMPVGVFGILKIVIGYLAGTTSLFIEVDYPGAVEIH